MRTCTHTGCTKPHRARGLCSTHWNQAYGKRRAKVEVPCSACGAPCSKERRDFTKRTPYCSLACRDAARFPAKGLRSQLPQEHPVMALINDSMKSPLRLALERQDHPAIIDTLRAWTLDTGGCWVWQRKVSKDGYPIVRVAGRDKLVHRIMLEASLGRSLGTEPAHHKCANTLCVNPEHLQPVTHRENVAEMLARRALEARIGELETALAAIDASHPLLRTTKSA